uniref:Uncharacterized protein n=1 Tax=Solanum tuberosum TaxID=4113 RepID=M1DE83_SOLTU
MLRVLEITARREKEKFKHSFKILAIVEEIREGFDPYDVYNLLSNNLKVEDDEMFLTHMRMSYIIGSSIEHRYGDEFRQLKVLINDIPIWVKGHTFQMVPYCF